MTECLEAFAEGDGAQCAAQGAECFDPERRGEGEFRCEDVCPALNQCGFVNGDIDECINGCLQADRQDPAGNERIRECIGNALGNGRCDANALNRCVEQVGPPLP